MTVNLMFVYNEVIGTMSRGIFNPVLLRLLFNRLRLVTPRLFETPAANTIPLFDIGPVHVREIFGEQALELLLPRQRPEEKNRDVVSDSGHYVSIVRSIRRRLAEAQSYEVRFKELVALAHG